MRCVCFENYGTPDGIEWKAQINNKRQPDSFYKAFVLHFL